MKKAILLYCRNLREEINRLKDLKEKGKIEKERREEFEEYFRATEEQLKTVEPIAEKIIKSYDFGVPSDKNIEFNMARYFYIYAKTWNDAYGSALDLHCASSEEDKKTKEDVTKDEPTDYFESYKKHIERCVNEFY